MNKSELVRAIGSKTEMTNSSAERALGNVRKQKMAAHESE